MTTFHFTRTLRFFILLSLLLLLQSPRTTAKRQKDSDDKKTTSTTTSSSTTTTTKQSQYIQLTDPPCQDYKITATNLATARQQWTDLDATCYMFDYLYTGFQIGIPDTITVRVVNGVASLTDTTQPRAAAFTIPDLFQLIDQHCVASCPTQGAARCNVVFEDREGYPLEIEIDVSTFQPDAARNYYISNFGIVACPQQQQDEQEPQQEQDEQPQDNESTTSNTQQQQPQDNNNNENEQQQQPPQDETTDTQQPQDEETPRQQDEQVDTTTPPRSPPQLPLTMDDVHAVPLREFKLFLTTAGVTAVHNWSANNHLTAALADYLEDSFGATWPDATAAVRIVQMPDSYQATTTRSTRNSNQNSPIQSHLFLGEALFYKAADTRPTTAQVLELQSTVLQDKSAVQRALQQHDVSAILVATELGQTPAHPPLMDDEEDESSSRPCVVFGTTAIIISMTTFLGWAL